MNANSVSKFLEPFIDQPPCYWPSDKIPRQDQNDQVFRKQCHQVSCSRSNHFADADFFCSDLRSMRNQTKKPETGNHDREICKHFENPAHIIFLLIQAGRHLFIKESIAEKGTWRNFCECGF